MKAEDSSAHGPGLGVNYPQKPKTVDKAGYFLGPKNNP